MKQQLNFLLFFLLVFSCSIRSYAQRYKVPVFDYTSIDSAAFHYSNYGDYGFMKVYAPKNTVDPVRNRPLIVMMHGGAFTSGNTDSWGIHVSAFAQYGYVLANINYRILGNDTTDPRFIKYSIDNFGVTNKTSAWPWYCAVQDLNAAIKYLCYNKNIFGIDPNQVYLIGESAGGVAVQTLALSSQQDLDNIFSFSTDPTVGDLNASTLPACKSQTYTIKGISTLSGGLPYASLFQGNENIPILMQHNVHDNIVPIDGPSQFYTPMGDNQIIQKLKNLNAANLVYPCSYLYRNYDIDGTYTYTDPINRSYHLLNNVAKTNYCANYVIPFLYDIIKNINDCKQDYSFTYINVFSDAPSAQLRTSAEEVTEVNVEGQQLSTYPNPSQDQITVKGLTDGLSTTLTLLDNHGSVIRSMTIVPENGQQQISLMGLSEGFYFVQINDGRHTKTLKFIKS